MEMEMVKNYLRAIEKVQAEALVLAWQLAAALKQVIPDIDVTFGWTGIDKDILCFHSATHRKLPSTFGENILLDNVIREVFPDLPVFTPKGVWLTKKEAKKIRKILLKLKEDS